MSVRIPVYLLFIIMSKNTASTEGPLWSESNPRRGSVFAKKKERVISDSLLVCLNKITR